MTRRPLTLAFLLALALPLVSCGSDGEECDRCSADAECVGGLVCSTFDDGSRRCGTGTGTRCTVR